MNMKCVRIWYVIPIQYYTSFIEGVPAWIMYQHCFQCASYKTTVHWILTCVDSNAPRCRMWGADQTVLPRLTRLYYCGWPDCITAADHTVLLRYPPVNSMYSKMCASGRNSFRCSGVVSLTAQLLYSWERSRTILWTGDVVGPTAGLNSLDMPQIYCLLPSHCADYYDPFP